MNKPNTITESVLEEFPDMLPGVAKSLVVRTTGWFVTLGMMFEKKLQSCGEGSDSQMIENRAIAIAIRSLFNILGPTTELGVESVDRIATMINGIDQEKGSLDA